MFAISVKNRRRIVLALLLIFLAFAAFTPLPQSISAPCLIESFSVWNVKRDGTGGVSAGWRRNRLGRRGETTIRRFARPEFTEVTVFPDKIEGSYITAGDTLGTIKSYGDISQLKALEALRDKARAQVEALKSGGSPAEQEMARQKAERAKVALESGEVEFQRVKSLFEEGIASLGEWQAAQGKLLYLQASVEVANAEYMASLSGAKKTDVAVAEAEIKRLEQLIENVQNTISRNEYIISPIDGVLHLTEQRDEICSVERDDTMIVIITIPEAIAANAIEGRTTAVKLYADPFNTLTGIIEKVDFRGNRGDGVAAVVEMPNPDHRLKTGMAGSAQIPIGSMTMFNALKYKLIGLRFSMTGLDNIE